MLARILVAGAGIPLLLLALFWPSGTAFLALMMLLGAVGVWEIGSSLRERGDSVELLWPLIGALIFISMGALPLGSRYAGPGLVGLFLLVLVRYGLRNEGQPFRRASQTLMLAAYPGLFGVAAALRMRGESMHLAPFPPVEEGALWILIAFLMVWVTDSGAYFIGRAWGRRKLAPQLSPSKTWEGALGGWLFATLLGLGLGFWANGVLFGSPVSGLLMGMGAGGVAQVGDLVESALKREIGVKDFGGWLPGHGGVMDRFDSFLFVVPLVSLWSGFSPP
ncbi:MAG: phosphatidate cytidylyltransferase [Armatimonadetes bacterium]|nr:phosphatidate cytidylyltransferase [Armatimonadota bacterium]